jgi:iron(III) transport system substrate-binding protein
MNRNLRRRFLAALITFPLVVAAAACGSDDDSTSSTDSTVAVATEPTEADTVVTTAQTDPPESSAAPSTAVETTPEETAADTSSLDDLIAAANEEGALTIYSEQAADSLNALAAAFGEAYSEIDVEVVRDVHLNLAPPAELELETGDGIGDIFITTSTPWFTEQAAAGSFLPLEGPELTGQGGYDVEAFVHEGNFFEVGGAVRGYVWNSDELPEGLTDDFNDWLDPELVGRIGLVEPSVATYVDWYKWLEARMGEGFLDKLAAQEPRLYQSAAPMHEAVVSGEIAMTGFGFAPFAVPSQEAGAPIEFKIPDDGFWGAAHKAGVLKTAPHPNAAMLFGNFIVTAQGQELINSLQSSVIDGVGLAYNGNMASPADLTDDDIVAFQERFRELFVG